MSSTGGRAALSLVAVLAGLSLVAAEGVQTEAAPGGGGGGGDAIYMVPHLGKHPVLGPVTGAPPVSQHDTAKPYVPPAHVPISRPSLSVRTLDDAEGPLVRTAESRRRKHRRSPEVIEGIPRIDTDCYRKCRRLRLRGERFLH